MEKLAPDFCTTHERTFYKNDIYPPPIDFGVSQAVSEMRVDEIARIKILAQLDQGILPRTWPAFTSHEYNWVPAHEDRYLIEIVPIESSGNMSNLYRTWDRQTGRLLLAKECIYGFEKLPTAIQTELEAKTLAQLQHPNITTVYDIVNNGKQKYFLMEYLPAPEWQNLQFIPDTGLPVQDIFHILHDLGELSPYLHRKSIVHRDIKPANLMYNASTQTTKLLDFGIANTIKKDNFQVHGTPSYLSPESISLQEITERTDVFVIAAITYHLLTNEVLYAGNLPEQVFAQILDQPFLLLNTNHRRLMGRLFQKKVSLTHAEKVFQKALAKHPRERYATVKEFAEEFKQLFAKKTKKSILNGR